MTIATVFLILALVAFIAAAIGRTYRKVNMIAVGLAFWVVSLLLPIFHIG